MKLNGHRSAVAGNASQARGIATSPGGVAHGQNRPVLAALRRIPLAVIVFAVVVVGGLAVYFWKEIFELLAQLLAGGFLLVVLWAIKEFFAWLFAWPIRKFSEGVRQIKLALDWTPGWVYLVLFAALAVSDWCGVLPYGVRDLGTWMSTSSSTNAASVPGDLAPPHQALTGGPRLAPHDTKSDIGRAFR